MRSLSGVWKQMTLHISVQASHNWPEPLVNQICDSLISNESTIWTANQNIREALRQANQWKDRTELSGKSTSNILNFCEV